MDDQLLITGEVATFLRQPEATVRYWRHIGYGPRSFKVGRRVLYKQTEVALWLEEQANSARAS